MHPGLTLLGREWPNDASPAQCVCCGKLVRHTSDHGTAGYFSTRLLGDLTCHLYCADKVPCGVFVWSCQDCGLDSVGPECAHCRRPRRAVDVEVYDPRGPGRRHALKDSLRRICAALGVEPPALPNGPAPATMAPEPPAQRTKRKR